MTKTVVVASKNPVKIAAAERSFRSMFLNDSFSFEGVSAASDVSDQPMTNAETRDGARNRVKNAKAAHPDADFWISFEGGLEDIEGTITSVIWVAVQDKKGHTSETRCATFILPEKVAALVRGGMELGKADDLVFNCQNSKHQGGAIGLLTHDVLSRADVYAQGGMLALIPYRNPDLYKKET